MYAKHSPTIFFDLDGRQARTRWGPFGLFGEDPLGEDPVYGWKANRLQWFIAYLIARYGQTYASFFFDIAKNGGIFSLKGLLFFIVGPGGVANGIRVAFGAVSAMYEARLEFYADWIDQV